MSDFQALAAQIRQPRQDSSIPLNKGFEVRLTARLTQLGVSVKDYTVSRHDYQRYVRKAGYHKRYPGYYAGNFPEKSLEHYIAADLLGISASDTYIDIASEQSPAPEIYHRLFGASVYRQDLTYPPGLHGDTIGSDAAELPLPDAFASKVALHCSFEHFEGDSDVRFVREIGRVLRPGGAACIVPFYMAESYSVMTDPTVSVPAGVVFEADSTVYCVEGWGNRHGRFYDPEHVADRIVQGLGRLSALVYRITNSPDVDPSCYVRFALLLSRHGP